MCCTCKVAFLLIRAIVVFHRSPALPSPLSITRFYILFEQTINIIKSFAFSPGYILSSIEILNLNYAPPGAKFDDDNDRDTPFPFFIYYISKLLQKLKFHFYANPYSKECPKFILIVESK